jgi:hypothetical protein
MDEDEMKPDKPEGNEASIVDAEASVADAAEDARRSARRKFLAGSGTVFVTTLASRPALAAKTCTPSGLQSGNLSGVQANCAGFTPGFWQGGASDLAWQMVEQVAGYTKGTLFNSVFGNAYDGPYYVDPSRSAGPNPTFLDALPPNGGTSQYILRPVPGDPGDDSGEMPSLTAHIVAALLNAAFFAHPEVDYDFGYTYTEVITKVCDTLDQAILEAASGHPDVALNIKNQLLNDLVIMNEQYHPPAPT